MKFKFIIFFLILFSLNTSAQEINLLKPIYSPGETLQADIDLQTMALTKDITPSNVAFLNASQQNMAVGVILTKISENHYFIYFDLPTQLKDGIYYLNIKDINYRENEVLKQTTISEQFNIIKTEPIISISPAMIKTELEKARTSFKIQLKNQGDETADFTITALKSFASPSPSFISIPTGTTKEFDIYLYSFEIREEDSTNIVLANTNNYTIPIWVSKKVDQPEENITNETINETILPVESEPITEEPANSITFFVEKDNKAVILTNLTREIPDASIIKGALKFKNNLNRTIYNLNFRLTGNLPNIVKTNISFLGSIAPYETKEQYLWINEEKNPLLNSYSGDLTLTAEGIPQINFPIQFSINRTSEPEEPISLEESIMEEAEEEEIPTEEIYLNLSKKSKSYMEEEEEPARTNIPIYIVLAIILLAILLLLKRKKQPVKQTFNEYISDIEKKK